MKVLNSLGVLIYFITIYIDLLEFRSDAMTLANRRIIVIGCCESFEKVEIFFLDHRVL